MDSVGEGGPSRLFVKEVVGLSPFFVLFFFVLLFSSFSPFLSFS